VAVQQLPSDRMAEAAAHKRRLDIFNHKCLVICAAGRISRQEKINHEKTKVMSVPLFLTLVGRQEQSLLERIQNGIVKDG